jgi:hypothetical protein
MILVFVIKQYKHRNVRDEWISKGSKFGSLVDVIDFFYHLVVTRGNGEIKDSSHLLFA